MSAAAEVLRELLADGPMSACDATARMAERGFSQRQTHRARLALDAITRKRGAPGDPDAGWWWQMPDDATCPTCGRLYLQDAPQHADEATKHGAPSAAMAPDHDAGTGNTEAPSLPPRPARLEPHLPPRCTICGRASAVDLGSACPFWTGGQRCRGAVR